MTDKEYQDYLLRGFAGDRTMVESYLSWINSLPPRIAAVKEIKETTIPMN